MLSQNCTYRIKVSETTFDLILKTKALLCAVIRIVANVHALQGLRSNQLHQELRYYSLLNIIELWCTVYNKPAEFYSVWQSSDLVVADTSPWNLIDIINIYKNSFTGSKHPKKFVFKQNGECRGWQRHGSRMCMAVLDVQTRGNHPVLGEWWSVNPSLWGYRERCPHEWWHVYSERSQHDVGNKYVPLS